MDDLEIEGPVIDQTLRELDIINRKLGGNGISLRSFKKILSKNKISSVADLGCGGADILMAMAKIAKKQQQEIMFSGIDANPHIVAWTKGHVNAFPNIEITCENIFDPPFQSKKFDIIHCCLFTHHFTEDQLVSLFKSFKKQARVAIIINDLHRHWLAYYSIRLITRFFSKSYMVRNDAAVSVARGFLKKELVRIMEKAGISTFSLQWKWAFRWQLVITCD